MKIRPEFRKIALSFAKRNGFDTVHFHVITVYKRLLKEVIPKI